MNCNNIMHDIPTQVYLSSTCDGMYNMQLFKLYVIEGSYTRKLYKEESDRLYLIFVIRGQNEEIEREEKIIS